MKQRNGSGFADSDLVPNRTNMSKMGSALYPMLEAQGGARDLPLVLTIQSCD